MEIWKKDFWVKGIQVVKMKGLITFELELYFCGYFITVELLYGFACICWLLGTVYQARDVPNEPLVYFISVL